jgi:hypothetical protein
VGAHIKGAVTPRLLPAGGAAGQVLVKAGGGDFELGWSSVGAGPLPDLYRILAADRSLSNDTSVQALFGPGEAGVAVEAARYWLSALIHLASGTTTATVRALFGGTAPRADLRLFSLATGMGGDSQTTGSQNAGNITIATAVPVTASAGSAVRVIEVRGIVEFSGPGTFIPQLSFSAAPGGSPAIRRGSFFGLTRIAATSAGVWS